VTDYPDPSIPLPYPPVQSGPGFLRLRPTRPLQMAHAAPDRQVPSLALPCFSLSVSQMATSDLFLDIRYGSLLFLLSLPFSSSPPSLSRSLPQPTLSHRLQHRHQHLISDSLYTARTLCPSLGPPEDYLNPFVQFICFHLLSVRFCLGQPLLFSCRMSHWSLPLSATVR
jgi:hypothetical protein